MVDFGVDCAAVCHGSGCTQSTPTVYTTTGYDGMNRVTSVTTLTTASGTPIASPSTSSVTNTSYAGPLTLTADPASSARLTYTDALGRLTDVYEYESPWTGGAVQVPASGAFHTQYTYDTLDDLHIVTQGAQTRTFNYDSLKRLVSAQNPEYGSLSYTYGYDQSGNLSSRTYGTSPKSP